MTAIYCAIALIGIGSLLCALAVWSALRVGGRGSDYEFWPYEKDAHLAKWTRIAYGNFSSGAEAVAWFRTEYPEWFARGVEMRVR